MIVKPRIRGFICTTAHPVGCAKNVSTQIEYIRGFDTISGPRNALIVGCSTGYGLASRITSAFGCGSGTLGVSFERAPSENKTGSAGWYNNAAFEHEAEQAGLYARTIDGDAFSDEIKAQTIDVIRSDLGEIDLLVYSLASPVRKHPRTGELYRSSIKPLGKVFSSQTLNFDLVSGDAEVVDIDLDPADVGEADATVAVMGGEDWEYWIEALQEAEVLAPGFETVAYTYIGNQLTWPIYWDGTLGRAKEDLDRASEEISTKLKGTNSRANVAVLKAVVTQASTAIPVVPLYFSILFRVMKERDCHEDCIAHIHRLFGEQLYSNQTKRVDEIGRIRMDNYELDAEIQSEVQRRWSKVTTDNIADLADLRGFRDDFFRLFGFGIESVDYDADVDLMIGH
ncbi:MAG: enoyl-ACP reductase FabV [Pseudomonadota bacterium]|nr:enoyl-ACP reductase FabV [Pseudomonadota bacterium]